MKVIAAGKILPESLLGCSLVFPDRRFQIQ